jgi:ribosomal protein L11
MNLAEIKKTLGVETINLNQVVTETNEKTEWYKDWDNNTRTAILIHKDTLEAVKTKNPTTLGISVAEKTGPKGLYTAKTIVLYSQAPDVVL